MTSVKKTLSRSKVLLIEPDVSLTSFPALSAPYSFFLEQKPAFTCLPSVELAQEYLSQQTPDIVFLSMSFSPQKSTDLLEMIKNLSTQKLIPLIFVLNLSHPLSVVPGTTWGGHIGVLHTSTSQQEFEATLSQLL